MDTLYSGGIFIGLSFLSLLSITDSLPRYPLHNEPGGGISPLSQPLTELQRQALGLTPPGLIPLTLFPPFATPRSRPAIAVIFKEEDSQETSPRLFSLPWLRSLLPLFRRRSPYLLSTSLNLEEDLVGYRVQYNVTCPGLQACNAFGRRLISEDFCTRSSPICRVPLHNVTCIDSFYVGK
eukprot:TRINITY_DN3578_c0_g1_i1.p1 TRINITY_DN3578_c0_g1~~TRINITY_DN3578_c0_g1_i1.p1  ORF type:complete len:180 (+),score=29.14 TRINITY_DN3578_c0_g1_i1:250-789(+)